MSFFGDVVDWFTGDSISAGLAKTAALGYASRLLNNSMSDDSSQSSESTVEDKGVRQQLKPNLETKLPVLYGDAYFGGNLTDAVLSADYKKMHYCLTMAELTGTKLSGGSSEYTFYDIWFDNNRVVFQADGVTVDYTIDNAGNQDISKRDIVKVYMYADVPLQPDGSSGTTPASDTIMDNWTAASHPMTGLMYAIIEVNYDRALNVTGLPNCTFHVENSMSLPGDVLQDYMTSTVYGGGVPLVEIDASLVALNAYASAGFSYTDANSAVQSGTVEINGLVNTNQNVLANMNSIASAVNSWISYDIHNGLWSVIINQPGTSIASLTDSNIVGAINISGTSLTALYNAADVKYQNTDIKDKTDFVKIDLPAGDLYENEPDTTLQIQLPFTNQQAVAIKVGLIAIKQSRIDKIITFTADYSYINIKAGQLIDVTSDVYGYTNKVFRVITTKEVEDDNGTIATSFNCLEYDPSVYTGSITELTIETDDGLLGIGSIGKPDVPLVTLYEKEATPWVEVDAGVPSGIVDIMEYWITYDVGIANDIDREYILIGTESYTAGALWVENDRVLHNWARATAADFFCKVRGKNTIVTGPYSDPSGLIEFVPIVVADTVSDDPVDNPWGELMGLGLLTLLNNVDGIYNGDTGPGSIFDELETLGGGSGVDTLFELTDTDVPNPQAGEVLTWNGSKWIADDGCCNPPEESCFVHVDQYPVDDQDGATCTGNYWWSFGNLGDYDLEPGTGNYYLYLLDGTLVETLPAASAIFTAGSGMVELPFADRLQCTNYYITVDSCAVTNAIGCCSEAIVNCYEWNFRTCYFMEGLPGVSTCTPSYEPDPQPSLESDFCELGYDVEECYVPTQDCLTFWDDLKLPSLTYNQGVIPTGLQTELYYPWGEKIKDFGLGAVNPEDPFGLVFENTPYTVPDMDYVLKVPEGFGTLSSGDLTPALELDFKIGESYGPSPIMDPLALTNPMKVDFNSDSINYETVDLVSKGTGFVDVFEEDGTFKQSIDVESLDVTITNQEALPPIQQNEGENDVIGASGEITITYETEVTAGTGAYTLYNGENTLIQEFTVGGSDCSVVVDGFTVTLYPNSCLEPGEYTVESSPGSVSGSDCGIPIDGTTPYAIETAEQPEDMSASDPRPDSSQPATVNTIEMEYEGSIGQSSGLLHIYESNGTLLESYNSCDEAVTITN